MLGAGEHDGLGTAADEAGHDRAVGGTGLLADDAEQQLVVDDAMHELALGVASGTSTSMPCCAKRSGNMSLVIVKSVASRPTVS